MFFILSKILALFVMPLTWVIGCFLAAWFMKNPKRKKRFFLAGIILLAFFSNQYISNRVMRLWEPKPIHMETLGNYDVGIVFSGVTRGSITPRDRVYFRDGADRATHTLQLYNTGKIKQIVVSGGLGFQQVTNSVAAERLRSFFLMAGVPDSVITVEPEAANTHENAEKVSQILREKFPDQKYLLITSAFHMKRSALCLRKQGIDFDQFPAGYLTQRPSLTFDNMFIPKADAINRWQKLSKEIVGIVTYKLMGYI